MPTAQLLPRYLVACSVPTASVATLWTPHYPQSLALLSTSPVYPSAPFGPDYGGGGSHDMMVGDGDGDGDGDCGSDGGNGVGDGLAMARLVDGLRWLC